jgi:hypothetical protein
MKNLGKTKVVKKGRQYYSYGLFLCSYCNNIVERRILAGKISKSCGCIKNKDKFNPAYKHGASKRKNTTLLYMIWLNMKQRCSNPKNKAYKYYGKQGISVYKEWLEYIIFRDWSLKNGYKEGLSIDRIDNKKGYHPENCRWITRSENSKNKPISSERLKKILNIRQNRKIGYKVKQLSQKYNMGIRQIFRILSKTKEGDYLLWK